MKTAKLVPKTEVPNLAVIAMPIVLRFFLEHLRGVDLIRGN